MVEIIWSKRSVSDINEIAEFIALDSVQYAEEYVELFFERAKILENYPLFGRPVPELGISSIRQILCGRYRIIYEVISKNKIAIITVHHQSRMLKNNVAISKYRKRKK